ncbi:MAG: NAD-dependent protein deacylase [Bacilli bacterium]|nr:NAD-dependent protein deacylase [Bacilli bacterium]
MKEDLRKEKSVIELRKAIEGSKRIVFLGGAGVSTASGIPDFRSPTGLYNIKNKYGVSYETMLSSSYFFSHTKEFYEFYWDTMVNKAAKPNKAHFALATFEKEHPDKTLSIITQNIDGLHQKAGSKIVYEAHGSTASYHCLRCGKGKRVEELSGQGVPHCECGGLLKPDVVLYEEGLDETTIMGSLHAMQSADVLLIGGTSMQVYPVAGFPQYFRGKAMAIINLSATPFDEYCDYVIHADIGEALEAILGK